MLHFITRQRRRADSGPRPFKPNGLEIACDPFRLNGSRGSFVHTWLYGKEVLDIKSIHILTPKTRNHVPHPSNGQKCSLATHFRYVLPMVRNSAWFQEFGRGPYRRRADSGPKPFKPNRLGINPDPFQPNGLDTKRSCDHLTNDWNEHREQLSGGNRSDCKQL